LRGEQRPIARGWERLREGRIAVEGVVRGTEWVGGVERTEEGVERKGVREGERREPGRIVAREPNFIEKVVGEVKDP